MIKLVNRLSENDDYMEIFMIRYCLSLIIIVVSLAAVLSASGGTIALYLDLPAFIITITLPIFIMIVLYGFDDLKKILKAPFDKQATNADIIQSNVFYKTYCRITIIAACIAVFIGIIGMLTDLANLTAFGPNLSLAVISLLYAAIVNLVILPLRIMLKKQSVQA